MNLKVKDVDKEAVAYVQSTVQYSTEQMSKANYSIQDENRLMQYRKAGVTV